MKNIPVSKPSITQVEKNAVKAVMECGYVSSAGSFVKAFEDRWAQATVRKYAIACNSGTNALFLAIKALRIGKGDEVIVPNFTMVAVAWAVTYTGATPVFADCDPNNFNIDPKSVEKLITPRTKAVIAVHTYGRQCDMETINRLGYEYNLHIIEDLAEAHGIRPSGDIACYSFYGNKILTTGEGGMCLTNDERIAKQIRHLVNMGFSEDHDFMHPKVGYNFRMTSMQAALGEAQVSRLFDLLRERRQVELWYDAYIPERIKLPKRNVVWMYDVMFDSLEEREAVRSHLKDVGIETRVFFKFMTSQPTYNREPIKADSIENRGLYLPTYPELKEEEIKHICAEIDKALTSLV